MGIERGGNIDRLNPAYQIDKGNEYGSTNASYNPLISVNLHVTNKCNYKCIFCFAKFDRNPVNLNYRSSCKIIQELHRFGTKKLTFVGGEPLLYPKLGNLLTFAKKLGITTMIVTNGSKLDEQFIGRYRNVLDWVGLSIDSGCRKIEKILGRHPRQGKTPKSDHVTTIRSIAPVIRKFNIKLKINTVVTKYTWNEDMKWLIKELNPDRWKIFQVLRIIGENENLIDPILISNNKFNVFVTRHQKFNPLVESNIQMQGSYVMIDPRGRFFDNIDNYLWYSRPILQVGLMNAFKEVYFDQTKFNYRGGYYQWD